MLLNYTDQGQGKPIVLLHGMAGSLRYWDNLLPELTTHNRVIALDLLGFGRSPMPKDITYDAKTHLQSISETLDHLKTNFPVVLVGHSMGALLALQFALQYPDKVSRLVLLAMPVYHSPAESKASITGNRLSRKLAYYGPTSHMLCSIWCKFLRPISKHIAPLYLKTLPKSVAEDSVLHIWQAYAQSLDNLIAHQDVKNDLSKLNIPAQIFYGDQEDPIVQKNSETLSDANKYVHITKIKGEHNIGVYNNPEIVRAILH